MWPTDVLELFGMQLSGGILASVQRFDGASNLLTLTQQSGQDDKDVKSVILRALQRGQSEANSKPPVEEKKDPNPGQTQAIGSNKATDQTKTADVKKHDPEDQGTSASFHQKEEPGEEFKT